MKIVILDKRINPEYATAGSAAIDLQAATHIVTLLRPGESIMIATGIKLGIKDPGLMAFVLPRSGLGHKHGIVLSNGTGLIDSDYTGQIFVCALNRSQEEYRIKPLDKIAQLVIMPVVRPAFEIVKELDETKRGAGGFGSTGK